MSELKIQMWIVDDVKPYELNAKIHSEEQVAKIAESIARFGWDQPIVVDKNGVIIKGHGRRLAAIKLGLIEVPVLVRDDLNEEQVKAARLADNRVAIGDIDADLLKLELQSINIEFLEDIFDSKELEFMQADLSEMNVDVIVDDLDSAVAEQQRHTANAVSESNEKPIRIDKVLGFSEVSGKESRSIHYFMAIAEDATGLEGKDAFVTYISKLVESALMAVYNIDVRYKTSVERTERVLEIAESFGLGLDAKEFVVFDNTPIEIEQGDIVYITGQSGGGKSTLLRKLAEQMEQSGLKVADLNAIEHDDRPIVDQIGETLKDALDVLTIAGITDAYIWLNKFDALSDGQRYRFKLAKLIESKADVWIADEFLAVLDRTVAKVVAYNIQKIARKLGTTVLVATTHDDMVEDLNPSLFIDKRYREKVVITKAPEGFKQV